MAELESPLDGHAFQRAAHMIARGTAEGKAPFRSHELQLVFDDRVEVCAEFARHAR